MPNTARWLAWVAMLKQSDAALVQLATMSAAAVLIWEMLRQVPEPWQGRARSIYLIGLLWLFTTFMGGNVSESNFTWAAFVVMAVVGGALAVWQVWRRTAPSAPAVDGEDEAARPEEQEADDAES